MLGERPDLVLDRSSHRPLELAPEAGSGRSAPALPLARRLARGEAHAALSFGGQGAPWWTELGAMLAAEPWLAPWIDAAERALTEVASEQEARWSGLYAGGTELRHWLAAPGAAPEAYLASTPISLPAILLTQVARFEVAARRGLGAAFASGAIVATVGYSQGLAAAALVAERGANLSVDRLVEFVRVAAWLGFHVADATRDAAPEAATRSPMAVVIGPTTAFIEAALAELARRDPRVGRDGGRVALALHNDRKRHVVSGDPVVLDALQALLTRQVAAEAERRKAGLRGGNANTTLAWEPIATTAAFHSPLVAAGLERALAKARAAGFALLPTAVPVFDPSTGRPLAEAADPTAALLAGIATGVGRWQPTLFAMSEARPFDALLDFGPGDGIARLSAGALRGTGALVLAMSDEVARERLFAHVESDTRPVRYADFLPRLARLGDGRVAIDNAFTRATGTAPIILAGMTPTTVDAGIVAAAANAGFTAELAGGGQVSERIFDERLAELAERLEPGVEFTFNALLLDAYLWGLQLGDKRLVQKARAAGHPIAGVTVSAGIPVLEKAVALLDELAALGMTRNAFKPGTKSQIEEVVAIARAAPQHTIFLHVEGGKAGGHHSWEDLDELLLETYHTVRAQPNLVLCVGGGVADPARAAALLTGAWSRVHGLPAMPVDAVLVGTVAMACREATASDAVKQALVGASGSDRWVGRGVVDGGMTSGRSQLDADIHYLENAAARCGRLLDAVAGDEAKVAAHRDDIVAALNATAKPYFGDLASMTWLAVLERMVDLMAIGRPDGQNARYEDGAWLDRTWRVRVLDALHRAEARLAGAAGATEPVASACPDEGALDDPRAALARFAARWPAAATTHLHPIDVEWLIRDVCARPGKPVPFVPVIDRDVRRWYKSDSLWQAQDPRFGADQVLVIPGPEAVSGIRDRDEPVAALLARFERATVEALRADGVAAREVDALRPAALEHASLPGGVKVARDGARVTLTVVDPTITPDARWLAWTAAHFDGPVAALLGRTSLAEGPRRAASPLPRLMRAEPGATLTLTLDAAQHVASATWRAADGEQCAVEGGDAIALRVTGPALGAATFELWIRPRLLGAHWSFELAPGATDRAVGELYAQTLFDAVPVPAPLFDTATVEHVVPAAHVRAYRRVTGWREASAEVPAAMIFSLAWPAIYRTMACDELAGGMLRLVHLENKVEPLAAWPLTADAPLTAAARVSSVKDRGDHRIVKVLVDLAHAGQPAARLETVFHIRGAFDATPYTLRSREPVALALDLADPARRAFLAEHAGLTIAAPFDDEAATLVADLSEDHPRTGPARFGATGRLVAADGRTLGTVALDLTAHLAEHPLRALVALLAPAAARVTPRLALAEAVTTAPAHMDTFAEVGGDRNPIHRSPVIARLAGLDAPIVHGMWTAARLHAFVVDAVAQGDAARVATFDARFLAPVLPGETLALRATRVAVDAGTLEVEATAAVRAPVDGHVVERPVASARLRVRPPATAWVFPGQGIQQRDMGMAAFARSAAARKVWERADQHCRTALGFSILRVVRENPKELVVRGERLVHPQGVLHLTQLTQVAMAVLAYAQVAELREAGTWVEDAVFCGHSVGEYNALSAAAGVLPLEAVVAIVYQRGTVMHGLVPRDAHGDSGFAMGVIRPHYAGLDHAGAEALVAAVIARTGRFLEIVNYNVRGRQYSVTGHADALAALEAALESRRKPGGKPPFVLVPGIDVPFHSHCLKGGVADFAAALERHLPATIAPERLVGRYVPNLVARAFALTTDFVAAVRDAVTGPSRDRLDAVLADWTAWSTRERAPALTRLLLVELLAWQFASPVRWIETQELMFAPTANGGLGVARLVEVGVGYQPTLANMAKASLERLPARVAVLNVEADRALVFAEDADLAAVAAAPPVASAPPTPSPTSRATTASAPAPAAIAAPPAAAAAPTSVDRPADAPLTHAEALTSILALQAKVRPDQIGRAETIDGLFDGVSSRRNQVLVDIGAEFDLGTIDRAHETPLAELAAETARRARTWRAPGPYLHHAYDDALKKLLARAAMSSKDVATWLESEYGFGPGLVGATLDVLALETRAGHSARGGDLGRLGGDAPATKDAVRALVARAVTLLGESRGTTYGRLVSGPAAGGAVVDSAALVALEDKLLGEHGALMQAARALAEAGGHGLGAPAVAAPAIDPALATLAAELGQGFAALVAPAFDSHRHVAFTASWMPAQRDLVKAAFDRLNGRIDDARVAAELARLAPHAALPRLAACARWLATRAAHIPTLADALARFAAATPAGAPSGGAFTGRTALVTGASPGSIAEVVVARLLAGGATVIATTSNATRDRLAFYRRLFERHAAPGAELHVVPFNQASFQDCDALVDWLFRVETEQAGATVRVLKPALRPDLVVPFAALKDQGTADQLGTAAEAGLRAMVLGTERVIATIGRRLAALGEGTTCHVLLPLSPNHGAFGGDGAYAESKAALEVMLQKWKSERHAWGRATTMVGARIGWVRGTGLMAHNDRLAPRLEAAAGLRTFSTDEMGDLLVDLLGDATRERAGSAPVVVDLTGGFADVPDLKAAVDAVRQGLEAEHAITAGKAELARREAERLAPKATTTAKTVTPLPDLPAAPAPDADLTMAWPAPVKAALEDLIVVVGFGEVSPGGSARTRHELETTGRLSAPAVLELAWMTGLVRFEATPRGGAWIDAASGEAVPEGELAARYHDRVREACGVRFIEPQTTGFDAERAPVMELVYLERDLTFRAGSEEEARSFLAADPQGTAIAERDGDWHVTRKAGSQIRVPREVKLSRRVGGQLPRGFDLARFGFHGDMLESVDRVALMNLLATVDSFVAAGTTPEELLRYVHPARVGSTQSSGMGGMQSLHRLYVDHLLGRERQSDILQETLINVVFAYAQTAYVGGYGPLSNPVAACATAAISLEDACDKIRLGKADVVMTGGWDDLSHEGVLGFGDMSATAETDKMLAMGLAPDQMSRANDRRRKGFVEAQGGGAILLARGDVALAMGLPVYAVVAYTGSFADGINRSIPAPGIGALGAVLGGARSPLAKALGALGLTADDIAVVSKHDTSTLANDPNESGLHHMIQDALGRTPGNPLMAVSQKALLGHAKGGAAAWQAIGLCQILASGSVPGNRNLESIDPALEPHRHLLYTNERLDPGPALPLRAGVLTSLGFGHVSALVCLVHPAAFVQALPEDRRAGWLAAQAERRERARHHWAEVLMGRRPHFAKRDDRRFAAHDGTDAQRAEEAMMLADPSMRFDPQTGTFRSTATPGAQA